MKDTSEEVRQTCAARLTSAASSAAVYFAICCRIASAAVLTSAAKTTGAADETVMAIARQNSNVFAHLQPWHHSGFSQLIAQGTPKRSVSTPKQAAQNVF